jgi:hypothetical protein
VFIVLCAILASAGALAACGSGGQSAQSSTSTPAASTSTPAATPFDTSSATDDTTTSTMSEPSIPDCAKFVGKPVKLILNPANPMGTTKCTIAGYGGDPQEVLVERRATCTDGTPVYAFFAFEGVKGYIGAANGVLREESLGDVQKACGGGKNAPPQGTTYQVTTDGNGFSSITYFTTSGQAQDTDVAGSSWSKNFPEGVQTPIVSAQGNGSGSYVACKILRDERVTKSNKSTGPYAVVSCG